jgi:hypothetical protein
VLTESEGEVVASCEVDPLKLSTTSTAAAAASSSSTNGAPASLELQQNRRQLVAQVEEAWRRVVATVDVFPAPLRRVFAQLRCRLDRAGRGDLADNLCLFFY